MFEEKEAIGKKGKIKVSYVKKENKEGNTSLNVYKDRDRSKDRNHDRANSTSRSKRWSTTEQQTQHKNPKKSRTLPGQQISPKSREWLSQYQDEREMPNVSQSHDDYLISNEESITSEDAEFKALLKSQRQNEIKVYGENACQAIFKYRKESIIKAWFVESITYRFKNTLSFLAKQKLGYNIVAKEELIKIAGTEHHGGVCFIVKKRPYFELNEYIQSAQKNDCILALEGVANPHNIGAIVRSAAHFGVKAIIHQDPSILESGAAIRTAEGGAEFVKPINTIDFYDSLICLQKAGYTLISTSSHQGKPLSKTKLPNKCVLLIGQEQDGLTDSTWEKGNLKISIDGTGQVESLNVSVATAIILSKWWQDTHFFQKNDSQ
ncbi:tRNA/rRNA methyltransferase [Thorsellia kenyensis]|uniref:tRNA/rRNA methyltransferase n=1 Tax=Thorsellia kenyensis TaxID=1549888 RepID=A0ABV6CA03_9GAMM